MIKAPPKQCKVSFRYYPTGGWIVTRTHLSVGDAGCGAAAHRRDLRKACRGVGQAREPCLCRRFWFSLEHGLWSQRQPHSPEAACGRALDRGPGSVGGGGLGRLHWTCSPATGVLQARGPPWRAADSGAPARARSLQGSALSEGRGRPGARSPRTHTRLPRCSVCRSASLPTPG